MAVYYTSDLHLEHEKAAKERGYKASQQHDKKVYKNIANTINKNDILYILGDIIDLENTGYETTIKNFNDFIEQEFDNSKIKNSVRQPR